MSLELIGRIHKELSITGSALYEALLAISERVNRKAQIIRLHWQASTLLARMDQLTGDLGIQLVDQVSRRFIGQGRSDHDLGGLDAAVTGATARVRDLKQQLVRLDIKIRDLKLEVAHQNLLRLQRNLSLRSAAIEPVVISREAPAVGQPVCAFPACPSLHLAVILRGPVLLPPTDDVVFFPDDVVVVIGQQAELDRVIVWLTGARPASASPPR